MDKALSPHPPSKLGTHFDTVVFEPKRKIRLGRSKGKVTSYVTFTPYLDSFGMFHHFLQANKADVKDPLCVGHFAGANKIGLCIDQTPITRDFCKQNPCDSADERLNMEITYLEEIYHSMYKTFLCATDHLDCHYDMYWHPGSVIY